MSTLIQSFKGWLNSGLSFVYPEICQLCRAARATPAEAFVCGKCRGRVRFITPPYCARCGLPFAGAITNEFECARCRESTWHFCSARSAVVARDEALEIIHRYKYQRAFWFEPLLAGWMIDAAAAPLAGGGWDWIVPVPLYPAREREREFNQAERLGKRLSAATGIPLNGRLLRRARATRTQTRLSRQERLANVRNAFVLRAGQRLAGQRIVLVDDVFTTGATTGACARALRAAGAGEVCVWTVARGV